MVHIAESTVGRRYAGWFIKNTERAQKIYDDLTSFSSPPLSNASSVSSGRVNAVATASAIAPPGGIERETDSRAQAQGQKAPVALKKVTWGSAKA